MTHKWPDIPFPFFESEYSKGNYRTGYLAGYLEETVTVFADPRTKRAQAYFAGYKAGDIDREAGVIHDTSYVPVPKKYTSSHTRSAYRAAYNISRDIIETGIPNARANELYSINRTRFTNNSTWGSGAAFDAGWIAGGLELESSKLLPPPKGFAFPLPPPVPVPAEAAQ